MMFQDMINICLFIYDLVTIKNIPSKITWICMSNIQHFLDAIGVLQFVTVINFKDGILLHDTG